MFRAVVALSSLLLAAAVLFAGNGLQGTLLSVRGSLEGFPTTLIGLLMSAYFGGFILGCRFNPLLIKSVGHIRTFVALASVASAATLAHPLFVDVIAWAALRAVSGFCFAGLVMVLESWINERAHNANRGRVLSVYRVVDLGATFVGNALLAAADPEGFQLFALVSILVSIALVPVALTPIEAPKPIKTAKLDIRKLYQVSPAAALGAPLVGLANAAFWAVGPVFAQRSGFNQEGIALFMSSVIVGAALLQWPLGWLSDRIDRRYVMFGAAVSSAAASLALAQYGPSSALALAALGSLVGAFMIPMFGLTAAHANDHAPPEDAVATNGGLLLLHGCGSIVGAALGAGAMSLFGPPALFHYIAGVYAIFAAVCLYRIARRAAPVEGKTPFAPVPKTASPALFEISETNAASQPPSPEKAA